MSSVVNSKGWMQWSPSAPNTDNVFYREYKNTGPGSVGTRVRPCIPVSLAEVETDRDCRPTSQHSSRLG